MKQFIFILIMLMSAPLFAQEKKKTAVEFLQTLRSEKNIRVAFTESVTLPFLKRPVVSKGQLIISPKGDFIREMTSPKKSITILRGDTIYMLDSSGSVTIDKTTAPEVVSAITLLQALVSADLATLEKHYLLSIENPDEENWSLTLESKAKKTIFKKCTVVGKGQRVEKLLLIESDGVKRKIEFGKLNADATLTAKEKKFFKQP